MKKDSERHVMLKREALPATADGSSGPRENHSEGGGEASSDKEAQLAPKLAEEDTVQMLEPLLWSGKLSSSAPFLKKIMETLHHILKELLEPPTFAAIIGFVVGTIPWIKSLIIGESAPLRAIQDSFKILGDGNLPCTTLILGGNLTNGLRKSAVKPSAILAITLVRYIALPLSGIAVIKAADAIGFLPLDPLFRYVLLIQFTLPPAVAIGVMAQLFGVGQEECSVIFLWLYLAAALALTVWSTVFMFIISY